jgi:hypothetical protein
MLCSYNGIVQSKNVDKSDKKPDTKEGTMITFMSSLNTGIKKNPKLF